jgi:anti-anti-sigma factor
MSASLSISTQVDGTVARIEVAGELDMSNGDLLGAMIAGAVLDRCALDVVVDLGELTFLDASGVRTLLESHRWAKRHGTRLRVDRPHGLVHRVLQVTDTLPLLTGHREDVRPTVPREAAVLHR